MIPHLVLKSKGYSHNRLTTGYNPVACGGLKPFHVMHGSPPQQLVAALTVEMPEAHLVRLQCLLAHL